MAQLQVGSAVQEPEAEAPTREEVDLQVDVVAGRRLVLRGVKNQVRVLFRLRTAEAPCLERAPLKVACVLDVSGSMGGQALDFAKRACSKLVKHLNSVDSLHFIAYSNDARVVFQHGDLSETGKDGLKAQVQALRAGGGTNLYAGLELAVQLLGGADGDGAAEKLACDDHGGARRIFLFSDGCVNQGLTDRSEIQRRVAGWSQRGITTSSFGIGQHFDEGLMRGIAEAGKGHYTYLGAVRDIPKLVSKSIHDLLALYGSEATLDLVGGLHSTVHRIYGTEESEEAADAGLLALGDLHYENERMVLAELEVSPPGGCELRPFPAAQWTLRLQRDGGPVAVSGQLHLEVTQDRAALSAEQPEVLAAFAIRRAADLDGEIAGHLERGDRARACEAKSRQLELLREALEAAGGSGGRSEEALRTVLQRAERVAEQLDGDQDSEDVRRQCNQEYELNCACSFARWRDGCDSSDSGGDVANLDDLQGMSPPVSRSSSRSRSRSRSSSPPQLVPARRSFLNRLSGLVPQRLSLRSARVA